MNEIPETSETSEASGQPIPSGASELAFRSGFVALCGRPNVGKSTLLNALLKTELAVANRRPQTTRERMLGIWTTDAFQAVLVDTPGIHRARSALNNYMVDEAMRGARDVDLILMLAEAPILTGEALAQWEPGRGAQATFAALRATGRPIALVLTKVDRLAQPGDILPIIARWNQLAGAGEGDEKPFSFAFVVPTSAVKGAGLDGLEAEIAACLPAGEPLYDADHLSDRAMRWHAGERVRAALFQELDEELPYSCAVTVEAYRERENPPTDHIRATIHVERDSQKGIVIGRKGRMIKAISMRARADIAEFTGRACELILTVKVSRNWTGDATLMRRFGYHEAVGGES